MFCSRTKVFNQVPAAPTHINKISCLIWEVLFALCVCVCVCVCVWAWRLGWSQHYKKWELDKGTKDIGDIRHSRKDPTISGEYATSASSKNWHFNRTVHKSAQCSFVIFDLSSLHVLSCIHNQSYRHVLKSQNLTFHLQFVCWVDFLQHASSMCCSW